jgi:hypothetical protein
MNSFQLLIIVGLLSKEWISGIISLVNIIWALGDGLLGGEAKSTRNISDLA